MQLTTIQIEQALDALRNLKIKAVDEKTNYALARNTLLLDSAMKSFHRFRDDFKKSLGEFDRDSEQAGVFVKTITEKAAELVDIPKLRPISLAALLNKGINQVDLDTLMGLSILIVDDLGSLE